MKMVPINVENIDFIRLDLSRHYLQIDCDFVCYVVLNPSGTIPVGGTDVCAFHVGAWQVDAWKFLTKDFAQIPGFSACLVWDKSLITETAKAPQVAESDIDTANSISSLKGQPVNITGFSMGEGESLPVKSLDDSFVNVKSSSTWLDSGVKSFPVSMQFGLYKVGDSIDIEKLSQSFKVQEVNGKFRVFAPCIASYSVEQYSAFANRGEYEVGTTSSQASTMYTGVCGLWYVDIAITDGVIDSLTSHYDGFVYEIGHSTPWHHVVNLNCLYVSIGF